VAGVTGATTSALAACAAFGLKLSPETISAATSALGMILGVLSTGSIVPVAAARAGTTATEVELGRAELPPPPPPRRPRPRKRRSPAPAGAAETVGAAPTADAPTEVHTIRQPRQPKAPQ
jgi:hypothetical protein